MPKTEEQCKQMREDMRARILRESAIYFAKNGFGNTKIGDLAKYLGIGQGTMYMYFKSKEELFEEIRKTADNKEELKKMKLLVKLPIPAKLKIEKISEEMEKQLRTNEDYAVKITIFSQLMLEQHKDFSSNEFYKELVKVIKQGQKEGTVVSGDPTYLADLYWGNIYLYALKKVFLKDPKTVTKETLSRLLEA
ncbi:MAG: TetR/AcrR family transcriptional regulator [Lachnospiraceae bacterium]|jgi:AcrR family transcriptional regulator|nr:TetR/AcrR family transcriptional regulator [Lachnospiraceae bacterium]